MSIFQDKTFSKIIHKHGGLLIIQRKELSPQKEASNSINAMEASKPVYPRLIKTTIKQLSIEETKEIRRRGLAVPTLTRLGT